MTRLCVVTGASRGIGSVISEALTTCGYHVVGIARTRPTRWRGQFIVADLGDRAELEHTCGIISSLDTLWGLVNNAAIRTRDPLGNITISGMQHTLMVNTIAPAALTQAAAQSMQNGGRVVNICSTAMLGKPGRSSYGASKAALAALTRIWATELAARHITVNAVSPGPIDTELFREQRPPGSTAERQAIDAIPAGRIGTPDEVARVVTFLLDARQGYLTGQVLTIDGGESTITRSPL